MKEGYYSIQMLSQISQVSVHTIRAWERRYQALTPNRSPSGRRRYTDKDIERLMLLNELCQLGNAISNVANLSTDELKTMLGKFKGDSALHSQGNGFNKFQTVKLENSLTGLLFALRQYKLDVISHELSKLKIILSGKRFALEVVAPLLEEVGKKVSDGTFSVAQEHALSSILKFHIGHYLYRHVETKFKNPNIIALATPQNELHEFGILIASLLCCYYKINFYYLGPNLPSASLIEASRAINANIIVLGATVSLNDQPQGYLDHYLNDTCSFMGKGQDLWLGGDARFDYSQFKDNRNFKYIQNFKTLDQHLSEL